MIATRAAVQHEAGGELSVEQVLLEEPRHGELLVRVAAAGVCHSDLHLVDGHLGSERFPIVPGHEGAGIVEAVGPGVHAAVPGDAVAFCFVPACRAGPCRSWKIIRADSVKVLADVAKKSGVDFPAMIGTMIELPRAAMTAGQIAEAAEFFSFGTNDLTQTTWGFSATTSRRRSASTYLEMGNSGISLVEDVDRTSRAWASWSGSAPSAAGPPARISRSASAASTAATPTRCTSSTGWGWTTSPAHRS